MGKKKRQQQDVRAKQPEFHTLSFNTLKEVVLAPVPPQKATPALVPPASAPPLDENPNLFLQAMENVRQLGARPQPSKKDAKAKKTAPAPEHAALAPDNAEQEAFVRAIGQLKLDVSFADRFPEDDELKPLAVNRLRQLKRGIINVDRQLDLHGLTRDEALAALPHFLGNAQAHGEKAVLVITGKGNNSPAEPVLQQAVMGWLREQGKKIVVEFAPAPREMGGSGAFVVFLRALVSPEKMHKDE